MALHCEEIKVAGYERVVYAADPSVNLRSIIAIHNTKRGPACGGIRLLPYANRDEALEDVLRLAKGMSYKSALANIGFGGGKSVIILDPAKKTPALFESFGDLVDSMGGRYIAAKDMNISGPDLLQVKSRSPHVLGIEGEAGSSGDPSPVTALGLFRALEATLEHVWQHRRMAGLKVALQGAGHVGYRFAQMVSEAGGDIFVTDVNAEALEKISRLPRAKVVPGEDIYRVDCDVFSPCARGSILNVETIPQLKCKAVVGCANNQLATPEDGYRLHERGILYAPDYAVNSGGIINIFVEFEGYEEAKALKKADGIRDTVFEIFQRSKKENRPPFVVADDLAEERLNG